MFCEEPEDIAMWNRMVETYPHADPYVLDLFVWCYLHKREEYDALIEKHRTYNPKVDMVDIMDDAIRRNLMKEGNAETN